MNYVGALIFGGCNKFCVHNAAYTCYTQLRPRAEHNHGRASGTSSRFCHSSLLHLLKWNHKKKSWALGRMVNVINVTAIWQLLWSSRRSFWVTSAAIAVGLMCRCPPLQQFLLPHVASRRCCIPQMPTAVAVQVFSSTHAFSKWKLGYEKALPTRALGYVFAVMVRWCCGASWPEIHSLTLFIYQISTRCQSKNPEPRTKAKPQ